MILIGSLRVRSYSKRKEERVIPKKQRMLNKKLEKIDNLKKLTYLAFEIIIIIK